MPAQHVLKQILLANSIFGGHSHFSDSPLSINISKLNNNVEFNEWVNSIKNEDREIKKMRIITT